MTKENHQNIKKELEWKINQEQDKTIDKSIWAIKKKYFGLSSTTIYYHCRGRNIYNCDAQLRVDLKEDGSIQCIASLLCHSSACESNYRKKNSEKTVFSENNLRNKIEVLHDVLVKRPRDIQEVMSLQFNYDVSRSFIYSVLNRKIKNQRNENLNISESKFDQICQTFQFKDDSSPFILSYSSSPIRIFVASQESLGFLSKSHNIHIDATYKLNIYGFPVIVVGFTDNSKKFLANR